MSHQRRPVCYLSLDYGVDIHGAKGASVHVRQICAALAGAGHPVDLHCTRSTKQESPFPDDTIRIVVHPLPKDFIKLRKSLRATYNPKLVIPPEVRQCAINRDAQSELTNAWEARRPCLIMERLSLMGVAGARVAEQLGLPHFLEVNALLSDEAKAHRALTDYATARAAEDEVLARTDQIFTVSNLLRDAIIDRGVDPAKVRTLPNAYDERLFVPRPIKDARRRLGLNGRFTIGMAGSMKQWHGVVTLLKAFEAFSSRCSRGTLLLVGHGPETQRIERFKASHPELNIMITGAVSHCEVASLLAACDVTVAPYEASELFYFSPMKVFEYMAMAKPVVASNQGQLAEIIRHGENGMLFEPGNVAALKDCLTVLNEAPQLRRRLGKAARESVRDRTWTANVVRIMGLLAEHQA